MTKEIIQTELAPQAIGTYSQAIKVGKQVYFSGQIPLDPKTMQLIEGDISTQTKQAFDNLLAVLHEAKGQVNDIVKLTIYLTDMQQFSAVNAVMEKYFSLPYPARAVIGVQSLPKGAQVEIEALAVLN